MKEVPLGILGSGKGTNCRAILESIRSGLVAAEVRVIISDVFDARILDLAREFSVPNAYLPPGKFHTRLEPQCRGRTRSSCGFHARSQVADARRISAPNFKHSSIVAA